MQVLWRKEQPVPLLASVWEKAPAARLLLLMERDWRWWMRVGETGNLTQSSGAAQVRLSLLVIRVRVGL